MDAFCLLVEDNFNLLCSPKIYRTMFGRLVLQRRLGILSLPFLAFFNSLPENALGKNKKKTFQVENAIFCHQMPDSPLDYPGLCRELAKQIKII